MRKRVSILLFLLFLLAPVIASAQVAQPATPSRPKLRTVTAFVRLDRANYRTQVADALKLLRAAKDAFTGAGYEVETIRITTQPFPEYTHGLRFEQALAFFQEFDKLSQQEGFTPDIGSAMSKDSDDPKQADLLARILAETQNLNGFITVAGDDGIHWKSIAAAARVMKYLEEHTQHSEGNFHFAAGAFPPAVAPFFPVSHTTDAGHGFAIGLESANIAQQVFANSKGDVNSAGEQFTAALTAEAKKVEEIAHRVAANTGWRYQGIDLTPVPLKEISIGGAMESLIHGEIGSPGSLSAAYTITSAVRRVPVQQAGYSGLMLPVLEDSVLAKRWESGAISRDSLMSYSSVCSTGLDAVPLPGDITEEELAGIIGDMASLAVKWHKPLSARLLPVAGKKAGEMTEFGSPYLVNVRIR
ncbi:MAG TPA: DUF711 family protein [Candidatus Angelobacter sp.]|nr:DUF711 family protein [Candidatus Angelobacter sp.]